MEKEISAVERLSYLTCEIDMMYHETAKRIGLSDSAMRILYVVCLYGEECQLTDIVSLAGISKQTINSALRKLEGAGLLFLEQEGGRGGRKKAVLTEKGKRFVQGTVYKVFQLENQVFEFWTEEEKETYIALTQKYLSSYREKLKDFEKEEERT